MKGQDEDSESVGYSIGRPALTGLVVPAVLVIERGGFFGAGVKIGFPG